MPLFEGHRDRGIQRLFIEMPDYAKDKLAWKWPDQQIYKHSRLNVDLDYEAVFTNLGKVIGVMGPGRHPLDEGASLALGWLVDRLTGDAYYDAEVYFVATREQPNVEFGGPVDNVTDGPSGLVVTLRVFGELAFRIIDPAALLAKLIGTGAEGDFNAEIAAWVKDQTLAAIRAVLPDIVAEHGVLAMGQLQDATGQAALAKANDSLARYGLSVTAFGELNVNLPDGDAQQLKQFAATRAYTGLAGSFDGAVRGQAALHIAQGIADGHVGAQQGIVAGMIMGVPVAPAVPGAGGTLAAVSQPAGTGAARFCVQCGAGLAAGDSLLPELRHGDPDLTPMSDTEVAPIQVSLDNASEWPTIAQQIVSAAGLPTPVTPEMIVGMIGSAVPLLFAADAAGSGNLLRGTFADPVIAQRNRNPASLAGARPLSSTVHLVGAHMSDGHPVVRAHLAIDVMRADGSRTVDRQFWDLQLGAEVTVGRPSCPNCGAPIGKGELICGHCQTDVRSVAEVPLLVSRLELY